MKDITNRHEELGPNGAVPTQHARPFTHRMGGVVALVCAALLIATSAVPAHAMPAQQQHASPAMRALDAGGTLTIAWANGNLHAGVSMNGLNASTLTIGYIVPGTCASPGGAATFKTRTMVTDGNGNLSGARNNMGTNPAGILLPKAFQAVQNRQIVACTDTTQSPTYKYTNGRVKSASMTLNFSPASGTPPTG